jgi:hypothetical protein
MKENNWTIAKWHKRILKLVKNQFHKLLELHKSLENLSNGGSKFFKLYQNLVTTSPFYVFFTYSIFTMWRHIFNDYDGFYNCNGFKYELLQNVGVVH